MKYEQKNLFPDVAIPFPEQKKFKYQIKRFDDLNFKVDLELPNEDCNPEAVALEQLGYFVIPEIVE